MGQRSAGTSGVLLHNTLGRGDASPSPCTPPDEEPGPVLTISPQPCAGWMRDNGMSRCIDIQGLAPKPASGAIVPPTPATKNPARFLRSSPTVRRLDARQRLVPLHRHSGPCPETLRRSTAPALRSMNGEP